MPPPPPHTARLTTPALSSYSKPLRAPEHSRWPRGSRQPRRPRGAGIISTGPGQLNLVLSRRVGEEQRRFSDARGAEDQVAAVGRKRRVLVVALPARQLPHLIRLRAQREDVEALIAADVRDQITFGRPVR